MIWVGLAAALALAEPPVCSPEGMAELPPTEERMAVVWVGPWRKRPGNRVSVVATSELRDWLAAQDPWWTGRTLQWLGVRRRNTDPRRRFQVRVMEVTREELCRPLSGVERGTEVQGVQACGRRDQGPWRRTDGCGRTLDRRTGERGATRYVVDRSRVSSRGFCVVPLTRYLDEVTGK